jgi:CspA family cold shock protein
MPTLNRGLGIDLFAMANGKVDFFNDTGGYGFITTDDSDEDVFFHMEDVGGEDLTEGTEIEFDIQQAPKGPRATNVVRA